MTAPHPRSRERFMALYDISQGKNATKVSRDTGRNHQTVMSWVHRHNAAEPCLSPHRWPFPPLS
ncbi:MAG: helix-turn-helix domain-containing protein [Leptolyngbyaceae cyanobacterium]